MIDSGAKFFFRLKGLGGIAGKCFVSSAIDAAKRQDVPVGLSGEHRDLLAILQSRDNLFEWHYTPTRELHK
jgi:hypothetical protein